MPSGEGREGTGRDSLEPERARLAVGPETATL